MRAVTTRVVSGLALACAALLAGCSAGHRTAATSDSRPAPVTTTTASPSPTTSSPSPSPSPTPTPAQLPMGGRELFPDYRIVAYYGAPDTPALGVLGDAPPDREWSKLAATARAFDTAARPAVPAFELIADVEQGSAGPHHDYVAHVPDKIIAKYLATVRRHHGLLILDIQPGRDEFLPLAKQLRRWLVQPDVELALDPEWKLYGNQRPDEQIGHTDSTAINAVSAWLSQLVVGNRLPQKMLLVHQFTTHMVHDKTHVLRRPGLALVFNMDGFGGRSGKKSSYSILYKDRRFYLGFKLFYKQDVHPFTPAEVLKFEHTPDVVEYQ